MSLIPVRGRQRQVDFCAWGHPGLHGETLAQRPGALLDGALESSVIWTVSGLMLHTCVWAQSERLPVDTAVLWVVGRQRLLCSSGQPWEDLISLQALEACRKILASENWVEVKRKDWLVPHQLTMQSAIQGELLKEGNGRPSSASHHSGTSQEKCTNSTTHWSEHTWWTVTRISSKVSPTISLSPHLLFIPSSPFLSSPRPLHACRLQKAQVRMFMCRVCISSYARSGQSM